MKSWPKLSLLPSDRWASLSLATMALLVVGCQEPNVYQEPPPPPVTVANPEVRTVVDSVEFTGTTEAFELVDIRARVEGFLASIHFDEGMAVKKGDLLFEIDPEPFRAVLDQAEASEKLALARLESAKAEVKRTAAEVRNAESQLARVEQAIKVSPGAVTSEEIELKRTAVLTARAISDSAKAAITSAEAEIAAARALVTQAKLDLGYCTVRSPIDGRAGSKKVDLGNLVGAGESTVLTQIVRYDPIYVTFDVDENALLNFIREQAMEIGDKTRDEVKLNKPIRIGLGTDEGFPHEGVIDYSDLAVDESTGTYRIRAVVPNKRKLIPPGAFARIYVPGDEIEATLIDPRAIGRDQSGAYLLVVDSSNTVERRNIEVAGKFEGLQAVKGDISAEDRVIVNGVQRARPGAKVTPQQASKPKPTAEPSSESSPESTPSEKPAE